MKILFIVSVVISCHISLIVSQTTDNATTIVTTIGSTKTETTSTTTTISTSTSSDECSALNTTCDDCLKNQKCFFCLEDNSCKTLNIAGIFPENCKASKARWISCSIDFQALLIGAICGGVVILMIIGCCICYCCNKTCKSISDRGLQRMERKIMKQRDFLKQKNAERKKEREAKNDAIRVKYGLKPSTYDPLDE